MTLLITQSLTVFITSLSSFETEKPTRFLHNDDFIEKKYLEHNYYWFN